MPSLGFHLDIMRALGDVKPNIQQTHVNDSVIISMVEHGLGVSILSELVLRGRRDNVVAVPLGPAGRAGNWASPCGRKRSCAPSPGASSPRQKRFWRIYRYDF